MQISNRIKLIIFLIALVIFGGFLLYIFLEIKKGTLQQGTFPVASIPAFNTQKFQIESQITESGFKFPGSLPVLQINMSGDLTLAKSKEIAAKFGFTNDPQTLKDTFTGTFYLWTSDNASLDITAKTRTVKYGLNFINSTAKRLAEKELIQKAQEFLLGKGLISDNNIDTFVNYYKSSNNTDEVVSTNISGANYAIVNFSINSDTYKILTLDPTKSPISVRILSDGTVTEIDLVILGNITQSSQSYSLKNFQDFQSSLNKAVIVSLNDGEIINPDPQTYKIQKVNVKNVELVYLAQQGNAYFSPVFLIKGTATITNLGNVNAYLYLSALK